MLVIVPHKILFPPYEVTHEKIEEKVVLRGRILTLFIYGPGQVLSHIYGPGLHESFPEKTAGPHAMAVNVATGKAP